MKFENIVGRRLHIKLIEMKAETEEIVLVDEEDYEGWLKDYKLKIVNGGYVYGSHKTRGGGRGAGTIHRLIMNPPKGKLNHVDHINGNKLDNRKENLRICTHAENMRNRHGDVGGSVYRGVIKTKRKGIWQVKFKSNCEMVHLGLYSNEIAAANAYNFHAKIKHGEFVSLNDVPFMSEEEWTKYRCYKNKTSQYHGVSYDSTGNKWIAQTWDSVNKKNVAFRFDNELDAAEKYNELAIVYRGEKAKLNNVSGGGINRMETA